MVSSAQREELRTIVHREAEQSRLSAPLLEAIITVESRWNPWALRMEKNFAYVVDIERHAKFSQITAETERTLQRMSFGLMQIMGGTARSIGFIGPLATLLDPEANVHWGARYFTRLTQQYTMVTDQIAAYNAGRARRDLGGLYINQAYVEKVSKALAESL